MLIYTEGEFLMKWKPKTPKINILGDTRTVKKFLIFPLTLNTLECCIETRWLEKIKILQIYSKVQISSDVICYKDKWINVRWVDE